MNELSIKQNTNTSAFSFLHTKAPWTSKREADTLLIPGASLNKIRQFAAAAAKSPQLCPTLCDSIDGSPTGSSVPGILQARILEWVTISFSNA